jgi:hypothetical protein
MTNQINGNDRRESAAEKTVQTKQQILAKIQALATDCHQAACALDIGDERTEMFEVYGVLHNLTRPGYAGEVSTRMNPLLDHSHYGNDDD